MESGEEYSHQKLMEELEKTIEIVCEEKGIKDKNKKEYILKLIQSTIPTDIFAVYKISSLNSKNRTNMTSRAYFMICEGKNDGAIECFKEEDSSSLSGYSRDLIGNIDVVAETSRRTWTNLGVYDRIKKLKIERLKSKL